MKIKNFFNALIMAFLAVTLLVSCETKGPVGIDKDNIYLLGNCTDPINDREDGRFGMNTGFTVAVFTTLAGEDLLAHGESIVGVRALVDGEVSDAEVIIADKLDLDSGIIARKSFSYVEGGWQYVLFDTPVEITGDTLYVGYKITSSGYVIGLEPTSKMIKTEYMWWNDEWYQLSQMGVKGYWSVQAILQGGDYSAETQYAIAVDNLSVPEATRANSEFKATLEVRNAGVRMLSAVDIIANIAGKEKTISVDKQLMNGQSAKVDVLLPIGDVEGSIEFSVKAKVKGKDIESEEFKSSLNVYAGLERNAILIEQFTGQNCTNCPAGAAAIKKAISELVDPNKVCWIAHHTYLPGVGDAFTVPGNLAVANALGVTQYPMCNINRQEVEYESGKVQLIWHPAATTSSLLASLIPMSAEATIELTREFNADTRELKVKVAGKSLKELAYITVLVNQDNMVARQAGATGDYHHTSPRAFLTEAFGDKLTLDAEGNYSVEYTYTIPEKVGGFDCVLEDMEVVAFVHGDINDRNNREIYNADKIDILK
jgi:hypothetical protein